MPIDFQCPNCKVGLMPSDDKYFFCCSCGLTIEKETGLEVKPDYDKSKRRKFF